jgi:capsular polysaccharide biosynthesis protein
MPQFIEAYPAAVGRPLRPLIAPQFTNSWFRNAHKYGCTFGPVHALGVWATENLTVAGVQSHLFLDGERFSDSSVVPGYVEDLISDDRARPGEALSLPERIIDDPVVVFMGWGKNVFGHCLVEAAPRIAIAAAALGGPAGDLSFLLARDASDWFRQAAAMAGARRFVEYDQDTERVLLRKAFVATMPMAGAWHPACNGIYDAIYPPPSGVKHESIFVTRRHAHVTRTGQVSNAEEIERLAERAGLRVVSPESMPVAAQAAMFANARLVIGEHGSALMNAVFCRPDAIVGAIGWRSRTLSAISGLRGFRLSYLDPIGSLTDRAYSVDRDSFSHWLDALLGAEAEPNAPLDPK